MKKLNVLYTISLEKQDFNTCFLKSIQSLSRTIDPSCSLNILVVQTGFTEEYKKEVLSLQSENVSIRIEEPNPFFYAACQSIFTRNYTPISTYRYFIPFLFPDESRALYIDSDILIVKDISELVDLDLHGKTIAGVKDPSQYRGPLPSTGGDDVYLESIRKKSDYVNSGFLLFDLNAMRTKAYSVRFIEATERLHAYLPDQDAINEVAHGDIFCMDHTYNLLVRSFLNDPLENSNRLFEKSYPDKNTAIKEAKCLHFCGTSKKYLNGEPTDIPELTTALRSVDSENHIEKDPFFRVLIPSKNSSSFLRTALESLCEQSFKLFRVFVCDGGSTDSTSEIVYSFLNRLDIRFIRPDKVCTRGESLNFGLDEDEKIPYTIFLNPEDTLYNGHVFEGLYRFISSHKNPDCIRLSFLNNDTTEATLVTSTDRKSFCGSPFFQEWMSCIASSKLERFDLSDDCTVSHHLRQTLRLDSITSCGFVTHVRNTTIQKRIDKKTQFLHWIREYSSAADIEMPEDLQSAKKDLLFCIREEIQNTL